MMHMQYTVSRNFFTRNFTSKILVYLSFFLGLEVARSNTGIIICQQKYTLEIINDIGYSGAQPSKFPMEMNLKLINHEGDLRHDPARYRRLVRQLIYLPIIRPDITYSVNILSQFI